jgi:hypothetical protein
MLPGISDKMLQQKGKKVVHTSHNPIQSDGVLFLAETGTVFLQQDKC